jgi:hypothetical protein
VTVGILGAEELSVLIPNISCLVSNRISYSLEITRIVILKLGRVACLVGFCNLLSRGIVSKDLNFDFVYNLGRAIGTYAIPSGIKLMTLGMDCRFSSSEYRDAIKKGIERAGHRSLLHAVGVQRAEQGRPKPRRRAAEGAGEEHQEGGRLQQDAEGRQEAAHDLGLGLLGGRGEPLARGA